MSHETRKLIEAFAHSHDPKYFAEDAVYTQMPLPSPLTGRDAIAAMLRLFYHDAFSEARGDLRTVAADTDKGLGFVEFVFRGRHSGDLMGIAATGRQVEVPMFGVYEIANGRIQQARLYYDMATLMRQLGQLQ